MHLDRYILRGLLFSIASLALALYEVLSKGKPSWLLIIGYGFVFIYGIFVIVTRERRPDYAEGHDASD